MKKLLTLLIASAMLVSAVGCSTSSSSSSSSAESQSSTSGDGSSEEESGEPKVDEETGLTYMADADDPITFDIFIRDPNEVPASDNPVLNKITELTGVTIDWEFLVGDLAQKVGVMVAGGEYPDAMFAEPETFIGAGALIPLQDMIPNYPNLAEHYAPYTEAMKAPDGNTYILEIYSTYANPSPIFTNTGVGFYMQKAVIEYHDYKIPTTVDEYFEMINTYQEAFPEINGVKTIGFEVLSDGWRDFCLRNVPLQLMGAGNEGGVYVDPETNVASFYQNSESAYEWYKKLNEEYHKGTIEGETFVQSYDQYIARLSTGAVLGMFDQGWNFDAASSVLRGAGEDSRTYVSVPIADEGITESYLDARGSITGNNGIGISIDCEEPERLLAFYDWLIQEDVQSYLSWGLEGTDFTLAEDGVDRILTEERRTINEDSVQQRDLTGYTLWNYSPKIQGLYDDGTPATAGDSVAERLTNLEEYDIAFLEALEIDYEAQLLSEPTVRPDYYPIWSKTIEDGSPAKIAEQKIESLQRLYYPRLITAEPEEYDTIWNEFLAEFEAANPENYLNEVQRIIDEIVAAE